MYERILVPLDGSGAAEIVLPYIEEIAARFGSEIFLASIVESGAADTNHLYRSYLERVMEQVKHQLEDWGAGKEVKVRSGVLAGKPANEILRYADKSNVSLIAMASRGSSGRGPWLLGSIAAKVIRATDKPVLLVKAAAAKAALQQKRLVKRILLPLDGSRPGEAAIPPAETLAGAIGAELVLFQVVEPVRFVAGYESVVPMAIPPDSEVIEATATAYLNRAKDLLKDKHIKTSTVVVWGSAAEQIIDYTEANSIDLIAMSTHGASGLGRWVFGSVTDKVIHTGDTPLLVVRPPKP